MRVRRNILAPAILTIGTLGSIVAAPALAITTSAAPAVTAASAPAAPNIIYYHT